MSRNYRLSKKILQEDRETYAALKSLGDYRPSNPDFSLANIDVSHQGMETNQTNEVQKKAAADAASDDASNSERDFHNMILGAKNQVKAQYGEDSNEYQSLGMKKKSEYRVGRRSRPGKNDGPG